MDSITHEILLWKHIETEKAADYKQLLLKLLSLGYRINSVTLVACKDLKKIASKLKYNDGERFRKALDIWYLKYKSFIDETTLNSKTGKVFFTHQ